MNRRSFLGGLAALIAAPVIAKVLPAREKVQIGYWDASSDGWAAGATALKRGDVFTIAGVYSVNPLSYRVTDRLQQFVVTKDVTVGDTTVNCSPAVITAGPLQTVECRGRWRPVRNSTVTLACYPNRPQPGTDEIQIGAVRALVPRPALSTSKLSRPVSIMVARA